MPESSDGILHQILSEGLAGVVGAGVPAGGGGVPRDSSSFSRIYDGAPQVNSRDMTATSNRIRRPAFDAQRAGRPPRGTQLAMPDPDRWAAGARNYAMGERPTTERPNATMHANRSQAQASLGHERYREMVVGDPNVSDSVRADLGWVGGPEVTTPPLTGPQFNNRQLALPGFEDPNASSDSHAQMSMFKTRSLPDGTTRGSYHDSPNASDWDASKSHEAFAITDEHEKPENRFEYGGRDPSDSSWYLGSQEEPAHDPTEIVTGGRTHLNHHREQGGHSSLWQSFGKGQVFGDEAIRSKPVEFNELQWDDDADGNYAGFTPDGEQAVGFDYGPSNVFHDEDAVSINGAGVGSAFAGRGFGKRGALQFAVDANADGTFVHGNSFTSAGAHNFQQRGALGEASLSDEIEVRARMGTAAREAARSGGDPVQARAEAEHTFSYPSALVEATVSERVHKAKLNEQTEMTRAIAPMMGVDVPDRSWQSRKGSGYSYQPSLRDQPGWEHPKTLKLDSSGPRKSVPLNGGEYPVPF